ncbi:MAG: PD40 domain-containing protein, partial [Bacteroides sp.]|nr:PD40 domain-containing protein [Bacteroides sp.]
MKKTNVAIMAAALTLTTSCTEMKQESNAPIIGRQEITVKDGRMTPEALWAMGRIGSLSVSPDGQKIVYTVAYYSVPQNKSHRVIYIMDADGSNNTLLTTTAHNEGEPQWIKGGSKIAFLSNESGGSQIWEMNPDGTDRRILSEFEGDIESFSFSPDGSRILFISQVKYSQRTADLYPDLPKASGIIVDDLMYKHWDEWVETVPHPFVASFDGNRMGQATDILEGEPYEAPMKPFGGIEQLAWSTDSKSIAYTCRKKTGLQYAVSTDSDIYLYYIENKHTVNLCKQDDNADRNMGYDTNPSFSPDGNYIAWQSMERDGYESDRNRLCVMDLKSGEKKYL